MCRSLGVWAVVTAVAWLLAPLAAGEGSSVVFAGTPPPEGANQTAEHLSLKFNVSAADKDDWYIADHPFFYQMDKVRAPNGSWVTNPNASFPPLTIEEWRKNTMERVPWWIRWYVSGETRELRKEMIQRRKVIIDHLVSPMDYGKSERAKSVRQQWHEQLRHFWMESIGSKALKTFKHNIRTVLFGGLQHYLDSKEYVKNFRSMNTTEWALYNNLSLEQLDDIRAEAAEWVRWKLTRPYRYKFPIDLSENVQKSIPDVKRTVQYFQPYFNYTSRYYNGGNEELPPPTMPAAISYPWPWSQRIAQLRAVLIGVMRVEAATNSLANSAQEASSVNGSESSAKGAGETSGHVRRFLLDGPSDEDFEDDAGFTDDGSDSDQSGSGDGAQLDDASKEAAMRQLEELTKEFHFTTGIPRMDMMRDRFSPVAFPSLHEFLNLSVDSNGTLSVGPGEQFTSQTSDTDAGHPSTLQTNGSSISVESVPDFSSREGVHAAARYFYSYSTVESGFVQAKDYFKLKPEAPKAPTDGTMLVDDLKPVEDVILLQCIAESPCSVRSSVTVYTPKVASAVVDVFVNISSLTTVAATAQRLKRQDWIMNIFQEAFDAERRVLDSGLVAPSTSWNSFHDRSTDIFADTVLGLVNESKAMAPQSGTEVNPREIFESLMENSSSPLLKGFSRYTMTNHHTRVVINRTKAVPDLSPFTSEQRLHLVGVVAELSKQMEKTIEQYEHKRDADPVHIAIVNATREQVYYDGRLFGVLGYGYFLPATNSENVAYRDHKIPVPFHLIMRVLVRLQESHLVLPEESVHLVACLAMLHFDIRYYRCNEMREEEKATPKPIQDEPAPLPSPTTMDTSETTAIPSSVPRSSPSVRSVSFDWM